MEGESRELSDAGVIGRLVGVDGAKGQGLAPGVGAGSDVVVDGATEELLQIVGGFEVERGGSRRHGSIVPAFEGAGDTGGDSAQQVLEFTLDRDGAAVEVEPFLFERIDAIQLVFEVASDAVGDVAPVIRERMNGAAAHAVPLVVDIGTGYNWDETH